MRTLVFAILATGSLMAAEPAAPAAAPAATASPFAVGKPSGKLLSGCGNSVFIIGTDGQVEWKHPLNGFVTDAWFLPNGNLLYATGDTATELTPDKKVVFQYKAADQRGGAVFSCQRLANGNTLVAENSTGRLLEVAPDGKTIAFELKLADIKPGDHYNMRVARKLANGNYLVAHTGKVMAREYAPDGKIVWEQQAPAGSEHLFVAIRKPDGNTLMSTYRAIYEYTPDHQLAWQFAKSDFPKNKHLGEFCGLQLLPNGNLVVGVYHTYDQAGNGTGIFEINRDKQVVWSYASPATAPVNPTVQMAAAEDKPGANPSR
jgi:outer membrane protein assembly factor BamB